MQRGDADTNGSVGKTRAGVMSGRSGAALVLSVAPRAGTHRARCLTGERPDRQEGQGRGPTRRCPRRDPSFNKKVAGATRQVLDARAKLPAAQASLAKAEAEQQRTEAADQLAAEELESATQEVLVAERRLAKLEAQLKVLQANVGDFARRAYQMGPYAEVGMVLDAQDPSDFTDRLAAIRSVAHPPAPNWTNSVPVVPTWHTRSSV